MASTEAKEKQDELSIEESSPQPKKMPKKVLVAKVKGKPVRKNIQKKPPMNKNLAGAEEAKVEGGLSQEALPSTAHDDLAAAKSGESVEVPSSPQQRNKAPMKAEQNTNAAVSETESNQPISETESNQPSTGTKMGDTEVNKNVETKNISSNENRKVSGSLGALLTGFTNRQQEITKGSESEKQSKDNAGPLGKDDDQKEIQITPKENAPSAVPTKAQRKAAPSAVPTKAQKKNAPSPVSARPQPQKKTVASASPTKQLNKDAASPVPSKIQKNAPASAKKAPPSPGPTKPQKTNTPTPTKQNVGRGRGTNVQNKPNNRGNAQGNVNIGRGRGKNVQNKLNNTGNAKGNENIGRGSNKSPVRAVNKNPSGAEQSRVSSSVGAMLAGLGSRQRQMNECPEQTSQQGSDWEEKSLDHAAVGNENPILSEDSQNKQDKLNKKRKFEDDSNSENRPPKKITSGLGAFLSGLGNRQQQISNDEQSSVPSDQNPSASKQGDNKPSKPSEEEKSNEGQSTTGTASERNSHTNKKLVNEQKENAPKKITSGLGAFLSGLGNRQQQTSNDERSSVPSDQNPSASKQGDNKPSKPSEEEKSNEGQSTTGTASERNSHTNKKLANEQKENVEVRKRHSLGSLLAGLANRQSGPMTHKVDQSSSSGKRSSQTDSYRKSRFDNRDGLSEEKHEEGRKTSEEESIAKTKKRPSNVDHGEEDEVDVKRNRSIGSILAGLANRRHEQASNLPPSFSQGQGSKQTDSCQQIQDDNRDTVQRDSLSEEKNEQEKTTAAPKESIAKADKTPSNDDHGVEVEAEVKRNRSIGSILSALANRRHEQAMGSQSSSPGGMKSNFDHSRKGDRDWVKKNDNEYPMKSDDRRSRRGDDNWSRKGDDNWSRKGDDNWSRKSNFDRSRNNDNKTKWSRNDGDEWPRKSRKDNNRRESWDNDDGEEVHNKSEEKPTVIEENNVIYVRGHKPKPKPSEKEVEEEKKALANNISFEEAAEVRKTLSIGAMLAGLADRKFPDPPPPKEDQAPSRWDRERDRSRSFSRDSRDSRGRRGPRRWDNNEEEDNDDYDDYSRRGGRGRGRGSGRNSRGWHDEEEERSRERDRERKKEPFDPEKAAQDMKAESEFMDKEYGKEVITVGFTEQRVMAYICEICQVQLTSRPTVESHIDGMQHLKKKNIWEKRKRLFAKSEPEVGAKQGWVTVEKDEKKSASPDSALEATQSTAKKVSSYTTNSRGDGPNQYNDYDKYNSSYGQAGHDYNDPNYVQPYEGEGYVNTSGYSVGGYGQSSSNTWNETPVALTTAPPPPPPVTEEPTKPKGKHGGATGSLLQRLDACAVRNDKDNELAFSVVSALLKSLKEFNHKLGDTKCIEVLTEIDIRFRSLKPKITDHKAVDRLPHGNENLASSSANKHSSASSKYNTSSQNILAHNNSSTWYSHGKGGHSTSSQPQGVTKSSSALEAVAASYSTKDTYGSTNKSAHVSSPRKTSGYASQGTSSANSYASTGYTPQVPTKSTAPPASSTYPPLGVQEASYAGYTSNLGSGYSSQGSYYNSNYTAYNASSSMSTDQSAQANTGAKDSGYHTQGTSNTLVSYPGFTSKVGNVVEIVRTSNAPPPPPPAEKGNAPNYAAQRYHTPAPPSIYGMTAPPPPYKPQY